MEENGRKRERKSKRERERKRDRERKEANASNTRERKLDKTHLQFTWEIFRVCVCVSSPFNCPRALIYFSTILNTLTQYIEH